MFSPFLFFHQGRAMVSVSCIIPAYNEALRIGRVLDVICAHPLIDEVIAVDDGSTDATGQTISRFNQVRLITQPANTGKSAAICAGTRVSTGEVLVFVDADLVGLTESDVTALLMPVLNGAADMSISLRKDALLPWRTIGLDYLSGERAFRRELIAAHLDVIAALPGFGLESYLNDLLIRRQARIEVVNWTSVGHTLKARKYGMWKGLSSETRMMMHIMETTSLAQAAQQISAMHRLRVNARLGMARSGAMRTVAARTG
jgi:glycosyltransferase involved in cell wall biosynthesis